MAWENSTSASDSSVSMRATAAGRRMEWGQGRGLIMKKMQARLRRARRRKQKKMALTDARQQLKISLGLQQRLPEDGSQLNNLPVLLAHLADHRAGCALSSVQDVVGVPGIEKKRT